MTFFSFFWFMASIRLSNFGSMNGPFFNERDISAFLASYRFVLLRRRTIYWSVFLSRRVFLPSVGLPHGLLGPGRPLGRPPSPPPCGWSRGLIAVPPTVGRMPR